MGEDSKHLTTPSSGEHFLTCKIEFVLILAVLETSVLHALRQLTRDTKGGASCLQMTLTRRKKKVWSWQPYSVNCKHFREIM